MNWCDDIKLPPLQSGNHGDARSGLCAMEMVAFIERLPHSDKPQCTCPVVAAFVRGLNDLLPDAQRNRLLPYLPRLVDTVSPQHERERGEYLAWAAITIIAPHALRAAGLHEHAQKLATFDKALGFNAAADAARAAAYAARAAAYAAYAAYAARAAAYAADAAYAARAAARAAAYAADAAADAAANAAANAATHAALYDDLFRILDGVLAIGPQSRGFSKPIPARELCELAR